MIESLIEATMAVSNETIDESGFAEHVAKARKAGFVDPPVVDGAIYGGVQRCGGSYPDQYVIHVTVPGGPATMYVPLGITREELIRERDRVRANFRNSA